MRFKSITISLILHGIVGIVLAATVVTKSHEQETLGISNITVCEAFEFLDENNYEELYFEEPTFEIPDIQEPVEFSEECEEDYRLPELGNELGSTELPSYSEFEIPISIVKARIGMSEPAATEPVAEPAVPSRSLPPVRPSPPVVSRPVRGKLQPISMPKFYPPEAQRSGIEGTVHIAIVISESGSVIHAHVLQSSGFNILDNAALRSVRLWRFVAPGSIRKAKFPFVFRLV